VDTLYQAVAVHIQTVWQSESVGVLKRRAKDGAYVTACGVGLPAHVTAGIR
jgi:hypothetical protein